MNSELSKPAPIQAKPITTTRVEDELELSSPLDSFLVEKKRRRGDSYCPEGDLFREVGREREEEKK
jgi:hypothetical protein